MKTRIMAVLIAASLFILGFSLGYWIGYYRVIYCQQPAANPDGSVTVTMDGNAYLYN